MLSAFVIVGVVALAMDGEVPEDLESGGGAKDGEEEGVSDVGLAVGVMLLGSLAFFMSISYLVNYKDENIVQYSWHVISNTISIFCAVLTFQSINGLVTNWFLGEESAEEAGWKGVTIGMIHTATWFVVLQIILYVETGAGTHTHKVHTTEEEKKEAEEQSELNIKASGQLLAHMTGFATINSFGLVQHAPVFGSSIWRT